jgi:hypothetical protein
MEETRGVLEATLHDVSAAVKYHHWLADQLVDFLDPPVAEIGAGLGGFAKVLVERIEPILASEPAPELASQLAANLIPGLAVTEALKLPLENVPTIEPPPSSIVMSNVLEHIEYDTEALASLHLVPTVEKLAIVVPAHQWAFTALDTALGHYRRYTKRTLRKVVEDAGWRIESLRYFNPVGALAWTLSGRIFGRSTISPWQTKVVEGIMPILRLADAVLRGRGFGQSVIALATPVAPQGPGR